MRGHVVRALGSTEEKADIIGPHKWPGFVGEGKEALAYGRVAAAFLPEGTQGHALHAASCRLDVPACLSRSATGPGYWSRFGDPGPSLRSTPTCSTTRTAGSAVLCRRRQANGGSRQR